MFDYALVVPRYAELHCHTNFSFLDGASHPEELVLRAAELGLEALAVTDHDGFRGVVKVHRTAVAVGLPVVYGTEVGMSRKAVSLPDEEEVDRSLPGLRPEPTGDVDRPRRGRIRRMHGSKPTEPRPTDHLVLLAPDPAGYAAISRFVSSGQYRGRKDRPEYGYNDLDEASRQGRLVALTGCHQGAMPRAAATADLAGAVTAGSRLREIFPDRLYVELWHHGMPEDDPRNDLMGGGGRSARASRWWPPTTSTTTTGATPTSPRCWRPSAGGGASPLTTGSAPPPMNALPQACR